MCVCVCVCVCVFVCVLILVNWTVVDIALYCFRVPVNKSTLIGFRVIDSTCLTTTDLVAKETAICECWNSYSKAIATHITKCLFVTDSGN